jgi:hypothetical protein
MVTLMDAKIPHDCPPDGTWLTNTVVKYDCVWPIRYGPPKASEKYSVEELRRMGLWGVYVYRPDQKTYSGYDKQRGYRL